jgi:hypothetical protein
VVAKGEAEEVAPHIAAHDYPVASCVAIVWRRPGACCCRGQRGLHSLRVGTWRCSITASACREADGGVRGPRDGVTETRWHLS